MTSRSTSTGCGTNWDCRRWRPSNWERRPRGNIPLVRLPRVVTDALPDQALRDGYMRAAMFGATDAVRNFGRVLVERPGINEDERREVLGILARIEGDSDRALEYIERGRQATEALGQSSADWDLLELSARIARAEVSEASRLLSHLQSEHIREPGRGRDAGPDPGSGRNPSSRRHAPPWASRKPRPPRRSPSRADSGPRTVASRVVASRAAKNQSSGPPGWIDRDAPPRAVVQSNGFTSRLGTVPVNGPRERPR